MPLDAGSHRWRHRYFVLRHGRSEANEANLISSHPSVAVPGHGLTDLGRTQAAGAAQEFVSLFDGDACTDCLTGKLRIITSDFRRAKETADVFRESLGARASSPVEIDVRLRERWFGSLDGAPGAMEQYEKIWAEDLLEDNQLESAKHRLQEDDPERSIGNASSFAVESVHSVRLRAFGVIEDLENSSAEDGLICVLVAHGDTLQILQTAFARRHSFDPRLHRSLPHLGNAEVRELVVDKE